MYRSASFASSASTGSSEPEEDIFSMEGVSAPDSKLVGWYASASASFGGVLATTSPPL
jgi:hypothetical protein